ncbi:MULTISPECIES: autotransporter domain-containing protein [unclassified Mesorhizobium]|uniref:autotransporter domain-containing protein n=1 Tax=unclassified Mesorhizobium TaxID=325217 RepID=UPI001CCEC881|nr:MULTISPECIES: autotransporter domain-containing protein [unclassified Mesorhizobium]MBZ9809916.1 autotransporter domain-containing protein [Mesorhizobium sp. ESP-6-2]
MTLLSAGTCTIDADQAGNANYQAAATVSRSFAVTQGTNVITFNTLPNRALGSGSFSLSATASSGLTVTFVSTTTTVCGVSGATVSLLSVGQCTVEARQAGNGSYMAAVPVAQSFSVAKAATTITLHVPATNLYGYPLTLSATVNGVAPTGSITFRDGGATLATVVLSGGTATFITSGLSAGSHDLSASYSGDASNLPTMSSVVSIMVNLRPDPSQDPDVIGLINAQASAMERFGQTQIDNIRDRLTRLHGDDDDSGPVAFGMTVNQSQSKAAQQWFDENKDDAQAYAGSPDDTDGSAQALAAMPTGSVQESPLFHLWTTGSVSFGSVTPSGGTENSFSTPGLTAGIDTQVMKHLKAGIAIGYASDKTTIGDDGTRSDGKSISVALYGSYNFLPSTFLDVVGGYGHANFDSERYSSDGDVLLKGARGGEEWFGSAALSREFKSGAWLVSPFGRVDAVHWKLDSYAETGSSTWALNYDSMNTTSVRTALGLNMSYDIPVDWGKLSLDAAFEDSYRLSGDYNQILNYADLTTGPFYSVTGEANSTNQVTTGLGLSAKVGTINMRAKYQLSFGNGWRVENQNFIGSVGFPLN